MAARAPGAELGESLVDSLPVLLLAVDETGRIVFATECARSMLGYAPEELIGEPVERFVPEGLRGQHARNAAEFRARPRSRSGAEQRGLFARHKLGHSLPVEVELSTSRDKAPGVVIATVMDATRHRELEEQFLRSQRTEALGLLARGVAHDFNNVLSVIMSYAHLMTEPLQEAGVALDDLEEIQLAASRAARLTSQLLAFTRRSIVEPQVLSVNDVVLSLDSMLRRLLDADIELVILPNEPLWSTVFDPGQLEQVILNLAVNACDAMPEGGKLTIRTSNVRIAPEREPEASHQPRRRRSKQSQITRRREAKKRGDTTEALQAGEYVLLEISDTGIGMSKEVQAKAFEPFFSTKPADKGTGLGLATSQAIVSQAGGHLTLDTAPGKGARLRIYLRRSREPAVPLEHHSLTPVSGGTETILLVEDEPSVRAAALRVLDGHGYRVLQAEHGEAALAIEEAHPGPIHLLLTDVIMPRLGGVRLAEAFRRRRPESFVLCMSGYIDKELERLEVAGQHATILSKPFVPSDLALKVRQVLDGTLHTNMRPSGIRALTDPAEAPAQKPETRKPGTA